MSKHRVIAIYLPQYHPFPENDEWWGKGFTEWTNVTKARPRFKGHYQPHLPADLGFYDLRVPEVRDEQAQMAKEAGIYGFCYYHYWFNGKLLMERPLKEVLESGKPDFPFMICWANENWTRTWDGGESQVLIKQEYTEEDALNHIKWIMPYLKDPRYIRIDDKPVISVYRSTIIPNVDKMIEIWREEARKEGLDLYICRYETFDQTGAEYLAAGFDAAVEFQPHNTKGYKEVSTIFTKVINKLSRIFTKSNALSLILSYPKYVEFTINKANPSYKLYPCVMPSWDNSPRRKKSFFAFKNSTPQLFGKWLEAVISKFTPYSKDENLIFINAWNEWAEGNYLEPDQKWGNLYLKETKKVLLND